MTGFPVRTVSPELAQRYADQGWWTRDTLGDAAGPRPQGQPARHVHGPLRAAAVRRHVATSRWSRAGWQPGFKARGVGPGDVVALQLPNWMEAAATFWAATLLGAVVVPIVHFYGRKEVGYILTATPSPKVFITTEDFVRMKHHPDLCVDVPIVGLVGASFDDSWPTENPCKAPWTRIPSRPALIAFTSGTAREPKGVVHSHQTLGCEIRRPQPPAIRNIRPEQISDGLAGGTFHRDARRVAALPVARGRADPPCATRGIPASCSRADGHMRESAFGGGPAYFITSLLDHPDFTDDHLQVHALPRPWRVGDSDVRHSSAHRPGARGSPAPTAAPSIRRSPVRTRRRHRKSDFSPTEPREAEASTSDSQSDGEILSRGPDLCLGYLDPELSAKAFDDDGWYHTGDIGVMDDDGYPNHHRPQVRCDHPWRREHQRP